MRTDTKTISQKEIVDLDTYIRIWESIREKRPIHVHVHVHVAHIIKKKKKTSY